jgi:hypothetical protein
MSYNPEEIRAAIVAAHKAGHYDEARRLAQLLAKSEKEAQGLEDPAVIEPPPEPLADVGEQAQKAAQRYGMFGPSSQAPWLGGPDLIDVPQENLAEEARDQPLRKDGKPLFDGFFDAVKGVFTGPPAGLDDEELAEAESQLYDMGYRSAGAEFVGAREEEKRQEKRAAMGTGRVGYDIPEGTAEADEEEDSIGRVLWQNVKSIPKIFQSTFAGFEAKYAADKKTHALAWHDQLAELAAMEGRDLINSSAVQAIAAQHGITEEDVLEDVFNSAAAAAGSEEEALQWHAKLRDEMQKMMPKTREGSVKFYAGAILQAGLVMAPALATGAITKNPSVTLGMMGTQVFGDAYAESRNNGRTHEQATWDGLFFSAAEVVAERIPVGVILGGASKGLLRKLLKAGATEGMEEMITESLNMGYEIGILDEDMTLGEALVRLKHAGIIGAGMGVSLAGAMHPFIKSTADPGSLPPQLREAVEAHQQLLDVVQRSQDPTQKVTRDELEAAKARYNRSKQAAQEAVDNPEYAAALDAAEKELAAARADLKKASRKDESLPGIAAKEIEAARARVTDAEQKVQSLLRDGMPAEPEVIGQDKEEKPVEAQPERSPTTEGQIAEAIDHLSRLGANAPIPEAIKAQMIADGLVKETPAGGLMVLPAARRRVEEWRKTRHDNVLNIGLNVGKEEGALTADKVKAELGALGVEIVAEEQRGSKTEPTMIATLDRPLTKAELDGLAVTLGQEAIAARWGDTGALEGPGKENWGGAFAASEFLEPSAPKPEAREAAQKPAKKPAKPAEKREVKLDVAEALKLTDVSDMTDVELIKLNTTLNARGNSILENLRKNLAKAKTEEQKASLSAKLKEAERVVGMVTTEIDRRTKKRAAKAVSPILRPEAVESLEARPTPTAADVAALQSELESDPDKFDLRTAELRAAIGADVSPVTRQAMEAAVEARMAVKKEAEAIERAEQENAAYAARERQRAKAEAKKAKELEAMIRGQKEVEADEAIALAEFLNKQEAEESSPGVLASALKQAYDGLAAREEKAMARLRDRMGKPIQGQLFDLGGALVEGSKLYADLVEVGALKIAKGLVRFADWSAEMVGPVRQAHHPAPAEAVRCIPRGGRRMPSALPTARSSPAPGRASSWRRRRPPRLRPR